MKHNSVLLKEVIKYLDVKPKGIYIDGTIGGGGHSFEILTKLDEKGLLLGIDQDIFSIQKSKKMLKNFKQLILIKDNFINLENILKKQNIDYVDGIILDLGVSSFQLDDAKRGFSYNKNSNLDMRMDLSNELNAEMILNNYSQEKLFYIFKTYGEEFYSKIIAKEIIKKRKFGRIKTTFELVDIIKSVLPEKVKKKKKHPAKKIFQSLRIEVNNELKALKKILIIGEKVLKKGGIFIIITFHSLEDRIVKHFFNNRENPCICPKDFPICVCHKKPTLKHLTKKVCLPTKKEVENNNRSRSAKLRVAKKL